MSNISWTKRKAIILSCHRIIGFTEPCGGFDLTNDDYQERIHTLSAVFINNIQMDRELREGRGLDWVDLAIIRDTEKQLKDMSKVKPVNITV